MKHIRLLSLTVLVSILTLLPITAWGQDNTCRLTLEPSNQNSGYLEYNLAIANNPGMAGFQLSVNYQTSYLEYVAANKDVLLNKGMFICTPTTGDGGAGKLALLWANDSSVKGDGTVVTIRFKELKSGSGLTVGDCLLKDETGKDITAEVMITGKSSTSANTPALDTVVQGTTSSTNVSNTTSSTSPKNSISPKIDTAEPVVINPKPAAKEFSDLKQHWAKAAVNQMVTAGIITGYPDGTFKPEQTITREEIAVILARAFKLDTQGNNLSFKDKDQISAWAQGAVNAAYARGLIKGNQDSTGKITFNGNRPINRTELATLVSRSVTNSTMTTKMVLFSDQKQVPAWAQEALKVVTNRGIMKGYPDGTFRPDAVVTRAEAAQVISDLISQ